MVVRKKMSRDCSRFRTVCLFVNWSAVLVKTVFKSSFCFSYVLYISLTVKSALLLYYLFYNLLLIRPFTTGSGTFILSRWSLLVQLLIFSSFMVNAF